MSSLTTPRVESASPYLRLTEKYPSFRIVKTIPDGFTSQIEAAVKDFIIASKVPDNIDRKGFYYQTLESIANATVLNGAGEFWLGAIDTRLVIYILAFLSQDIDQKLTYHVNQAWVSKDQRGQPWVKWAWQRIRQRAKDCFCSHLVITSSRGFRAYERFLPGMKYYSAILKEDL